MPAKKKVQPTAKKAARKTAKKTQDVDLNSLLEDPDKLPTLSYGGSEKQAIPESAHLSVVKGIRASMDKLANKAKTRPIILLTPAMLRKKTVDVQEIMFQQALGSIGLRVPGVMQIVAPEHVGKTSFLYWLMGTIMRQGCGAIYVECEGKQMEGSRAQRLVSRDKRQANLLFNGIVHTTARSLLEFENKFKALVVEQRKILDTIPEKRGMPVFVFADPWSGLMSASESLGNTTYGMNPKDRAAVAKDTGTGSNFGHSKIAQGVKRWLPAFLEENNAMLCVIGAQNDKIVMNKHAAPTSASKNDTTLGGHAWKQIAAYRMVFTVIENLKDKKTNTQYGIRVKMTIIKNSYGPPFRACTFCIYYDRQHDTDTHYGRTLSFEEDTAKWMAANSILGTNVTNKLYTCDSLGCVAVSPEELHAALHSNPEMMTQVGTLLGIEGYGDGVRKFEFTAKVADPDDEDEDDETTDEEEPEDEE